MNEILEDIRGIKIRKRQQCFACHRIFDNGSHLYTQVCKDDGEVYRIYLCHTCKIIMDKHKDVCYDEVEGGFPNGCVIDIPSNVFSKHLLGKGFDFSPEDILKRLDEKNY